MEQLTHLPRWFYEKNVLYVIDNLLEAAFTMTEANRKVMQFFNRITLVRMIRLQCCIHYEF